MSDKVFFEQAVAKIYRQGGKSKAESIKEALVRFPEAHSEFIKRVNNGGASLLEEALTK